MDYAAGLPSGGTLTVPSQLVACGTDPFIPGVHPGVGGRSGPNTSAAHAYMGRERPNGADDQRRGMTATGTAPAQVSGGSAIFAAAKAKDAQHRVERRHIAALRERSLTDPTPLGNPAASRCRYGVTDCRRGASVKCIGRGRHLGLSSSVQDGCQPSRMRKRERAAPRRRPSLFQPRGELPISPAQERAPAAAAAEPAPGRRRSPGSPSHRRKSALPEPQLAAAAAAAEPAATASVPGDARTSPSH